MTPASAVVERLTDFVSAGPAQHPPAPVLHEAKRVLLNQLKASAEAVQQPQGQRWLAHASASAHQPSRRGRAGIWWTRVATTAPHAAALQRRLAGLLDCADSHPSTLARCGADIVAPLSAEAQAAGRSGLALLNAVAVGLEVAIACGDFAQGPRPAARIGRTAALCALRGHDRNTTRAELERCVRPTSPASPLRVALDGLGHHWRLHELTLHCRPLPPLALGPVEAMLSLRAAAGRLKPQRVRLALAPRHTEGPAPIDLRLCLAAAWLLGQFGVEERHAVLTGHPALKGLAERIDLVGDAALADGQACRLTVDFDDGSHQTVCIDAALGSARRPLSDGQLSELFRSAAEPVVLPRRAGEILRALWALEAAPRADDLLGLLHRPT